MPTIAQEPVDPKDLEKILEYLPEPSSATVRLLGLDYSSIFNQAKKLIPDVQFFELCELKVELKKPSKERILDIYRKSYENPKKDFWLEEVSWSGDSYGATQIKLDPFNIQVNYRGSEEPEYITKLKNAFSEIASTEMRLSIGRWT